MRIAIGALALAACTAAEETGDGWRLVWEDEFGGPENDPPNPENWTYDIGGDGFGNQQLEFNTNRPENVSLNGNGFLRIRARREPYQENEWTSARITTKALQAFEYGRVEARIKLPAGRGIWPAFWMLGDDIDDVFWPNCGEIDIVEMRGERPDTVIGTIHGPGYAGGGSVGDDLTVPDGDFSADFHTFEVFWDPGNLTWAVDGDILNTLTPGDLPEFSPWVFDHPFFLILNVAVGGTFLDEPDATTPDEVAMAVDYVRVYERDPGIRIAP